MAVHRIPARRGATGRLHGPYWLWAVRRKRPSESRPEGEVKINFDYQGYLASPIATTFEVLDKGAATFLESFNGGDLLVASTSDSRAFLFEKVPAAKRTSPHRFRLFVQEYEPFRPIPDAFEWPKPETPPSEEEIQAEERRELERLRRVVMSDPGIAPVERSRSTWRHIRRSGSTR